MSIVRRTPVDTDREKLLADLAARPQSSEEHIDRWAEEDGGAMTDEELAQAVPVYPPPKPEDVRALRARLELSQSQFALMFGFAPARRDPVPVLRSRPIERPFRSLGRRACVEQLGHRRNQLRWSKRLF